MTGLKIFNLEDVAESLPRLGVPVHGAPATGFAMLSNGHLGVDMLHVAAGQVFPVHTHPGDHLLLCVRGAGTITVDQVTYRVVPGDIYMVDGNIPHAVGASTDHWLIAIGAPHKPVDAHDRMSFVNWDGTPVDPGDRKISGPDAAAPAADDGPDVVIHPPGHMTWTPGLRGFTNHDARTVCAYAYRHQVGDITISSNLISIEAATALMRCAWEDACRDLDGDATRIGPRISLIVAQRAERLLP